MKRIVLDLARWSCLAVLVAGPVWESASAPASPARPARIALLSDTHITRGTREEQPLHRGRLERVILAINAAKVDLVLVAGDLTEDGRRTELSDFRELIRQSTAPVWYVPGNHDIGNKIVPGNKIGVTSERVATYEWQQGPSFFVRDHAGVRVAGINGPLLASGLPEEQAMWQLLDRELSQPTPQAVLLLVHYPLFVEKPDEPGGKYWNVEPEPRRRLLKLAHACGARAVLSGHRHTQGIRRHEGILLVTTPPVSFGLPRDRQSRGWTLLILPPQGGVETEFRYIGE